MSRTGIVRASALALAAAGWAAAGPAAAVTGDCSALAAAKLPHVEITSASTAPKGDFVEPARPGRGTSAHLGLPSFCRVTGVARPAAGSRIGFEVWLPSPGVWTRRLHMVGNGGYGSNLYYTQMAARLRRGDVAVATDTGHTGNSPVFGRNNPAAIQDWGGGRAVHESVVAAKALSAAYYGQEPRWSYFSGSSTGGHQALMAAQRYPEDFDGIIAGAPGNNRTGLNLQFLWMYLNNHRRGDDTRQIVPNSKLPMVREAVVRACDQLDGVADGVINDPRACPFDVGTLICSGEESADCLTADQVAAMRAIYRGPRHARTGAQLYPGFPPGSEGAEAEDPEHPGWADFWANPEKHDEPQRADFFRYWVFHNAQWDWWKFDWDKDVDTVKRVMGPVIDATSPDLARFRARGGKLIMFIGWDDPVGSAVEAINYYDSVVARARGRTVAARLSDTQSFARLYLIPGMGHTAGGVGATHVSNATRDSAPPLEDARHDMGLALYAWVETGRPPEDLIATHFASGSGRTGKVQFQRPICVYPKVARYAGGDPNSAASFRCEPSANP